MKFAKWLFLISGIYGIIVLAPMYFLEGEIARQNPPAITHPEFFYGFVGVALVWQVMFLVIGADPVRFRPAMLLAALAKFSFASAVLVLCLQERVTGPIKLGALVDAILGILFVIAFARTPTQR